MAKKKIRVEQSFYDTDRFYSILSALGKKDATDKEIAAALNITPETFSRMKNGKYEGWTEKQNEERSPNRIKAQQILYDNLLERRKKGTLSQYI